MALLTVSGLALGYGSRRVADKISFSVQAGDYLCIVGENGAGKTTLMRTLLGLQPSLGGEIRTGDGLAPNEIGYLPQQTEVQKDFPASVEEVVLSGCQARCGLRPFYNREEKKLAQDNMARMGITALRRRCYRELSGGQQQRVLLARALCATRKLLLLDEPVSGLDPLVTEQMYRIIEDLNREGITIIMISHDVGTALQYASHILHVGPQTFFGTREEYLRREGPQDRNRGEAAGRGGAKERLPDRRQEQEILEAAGGETRGGRLPEERHAGHTGKRPAGKRKKAVGKGGRRK